MQVASGESEVWLQAHDQPVTDWICGDISAKFQRKLRVGEDLFLAGHLRRTIPNHPGTRTCGRDAMQLPQLRSPTGVAGSFKTQCTECEEMSSWTQCSQPFLVVHQQRPSRWRHVQSATLGHGRRHSQRLATKPRLAKRRCKGQSPCARRHGGGL